MKILTLIIDNKINNNNNASMTPLNRCQPMLYVEPLRP